MLSFQSLSVTSRTSRAFLKNATGQQDCINKAAVALSDPSLSTTSDTEGYIATIVDFTMSFF